MSLKRFALIVISKTVPLDNAREEGGGERKGKKKKNSRNLKRERERERVRERAREMFEKLQIPPHKKNKKIQMKRDQSLEKSTFYTHRRIY